jgi:hypothetical protein
MKGSQIKEKVGQNRALMEPPGKGFQDWATATEPIGEEGACHSVASRVRISKGRERIRKPAHSSNKLKSIRR